MKDYPQATVRSQPIGVFDSGLGGLTVVRALRACCPHVPLLYVGDTAHLPYGDKSSRVVQEYSASIVDFLLQMGCGTIVVACHTAAAVAGALLRERIPQEVAYFSVVDAVLAYLEAWSARKMRHCGLLATHRTVESGIYAQVIEARGWPIRLRSVAAPLLVPVIEYGRECPAVRQAAVRLYLSDPRLQQIDGLILGCTHYPLLLPDFQAYYAGLSERGGAQSAPEYIDPSVQCALQVKSYLGDVCANRGTDQTEPVQIYLSDTSPWFVSTIDAWLNVPYVLRACPDVALA